MESSASKEVQADSTLLPVASSRKTRFSLATVITLFGLTAFGLNYSYAYGFFNSFDLAPSALGFDKTEVVTRSAILLALAAGGMLLAGALIWVILFGLASGVLDSPTARSAVGWIRRVTPRRLATLISPLGRGLFRQRHLLKFFISVAFVAYFTALAISVYLGYYAHFDDILSWVAVIFVAYGLILMPTKGRTVDQTWSDPNSPRLGFVVALTFVLALVLTIGSFLAGLISGAQAASRGYLNPINKSFGVDVRVVDLRTSGPNDSDRVAGSDPQTFLLLGVNGAIAYVYDCESLTVATVPDSGVRMVSVINDTIVSDATDLRSAEKERLQCRYQ